MQAHELTTHTNIGLVCVSVAAAIVASYIALDLVHRSVGTADWRRRLWTAGAGVTMGLGIWLMHFIGMLALEMSMPVSYDGSLVILSLLAAVFGAGVSLTVVAHQQASRRRLIPAAAFMGFAIGAMHYLGMASMQMDASIHWNIPLVVLSLAIGFGASLFGLWLVVRVRMREAGFGILRRLAAAVLLGLGVAGLHYTAMSASSFSPSNNGMAPAHGLKTDSLVVLLAAGAVVMLAVLIGGASLDQRRAALASDLSLVANLARRLARLGNAREGACEAIRELAAADYDAAPLRAPAVDRDTRSRSLQGLQRRAWPPGRRSPAAQRRRRVERDAARDRHARALRRRGVRRDPAGLHARVGDCSRRPAPRGDALRRESLGRRRDDRRADPAR
jgi:NO-binding membrane sensor protein with MHYT domain